MKIRIYLVGGEEKLSVGFTVFLVVLDVDLLESLTNGRGRLVGGQNTLAGGHYLLGDLRQLLLQLWVGLQVTVSRHFLQNKYVFNF